jgi:hypothetical protein
MIARALRDLYGAAEQIAGITTSRVTEDSAQISSIETMLPGAELGDPSSAGLPSPVGEDVSEVGQPEVTADDEIESPLPVSLTYGCDQPLPEGFLHGVYRGYVYVDGVCYGPKAEWDCRRIAIEFPGRDPYFYDRFSCMVSPPPTLSVDTGGGTFLLTPSPTSPPAPLIRPAIAGATCPEPEPPCPDVVESDCPIDWDKPMAFFAAPQGTRWRNYMADKWGLSMWRDNFSLELILTAKKFSDDYIPGPTFADETIGELADIYRLSEQ